MATDRLMATPWRFENNKGGGNTLKKAQDERIETEKNLLQKNKTHFFSDVLTVNMEIWETKKTNGSKGGRPRKTETQSGLKPNENRNESITEYNSTVQYSTEENKHNLIQTFFNDLQNSSAIEQIAMNNSCTVEIVKKQIPVFKSHAELSYPTYEKFVSHFKNWFKLNKPKDPNDRPMVY